MPTRFEALDNLFDEALELPIRARDGVLRTYRIPSPSGEDGLKVQRITTLATRLMEGGEAVDTEVLNDEEELDLFNLTLGPAYAEMRADGVDWAWIKHAGITATFWITADAETAQGFWRAKGDPSAAPTQNRAARRAKGKKAPGSAAASSTKRRGSTSGTSGRKATGSAPQAETT